MRYLKLFENFEMSSTREEMIENLCSTSTFEREELEAMTDDELEELYHTLETEDWMDELDSETKGGEHWIGGPYHPREEEEGDEYFENIESDKIATTKEEWWSLVRQDLRKWNSEAHPEDRIGLQDWIGEVGPNIYGWTAFRDQYGDWDIEEDEFEEDGLDELEGLDEAKKSGVSKSLKKKSQASGIPMGILRKVFAKGMQAWNAGHRPGVAQHQWGMGRVNSFITGAGGARKADAALWTKAKAAKARKKKRKK
jgi:hypothetical protein